MRRLLAAALLAALALLAPTALGAGGITPLAPKKGDTVPAGKRPKIKMKVHGKGQVWVHVCKSRKQDEVGLICSDESIGRARRTSGSRFTYRPKFFDYPEFWLNSPGTYYWQAHRISCENGIEDCRIEGPTVKFRVG
jgi:hypothetical protein